MDEPGADPEQLRRSLAYIRRVNRFLGYTRSTLRHLKEFSKRWKPGETIWILDVATGSADVPMAVRAWAAANGLDVRIVALDLHAATVAAAADACRDRPGAAPGARAVHLLRADAMRLPFADGAFDYAMTSMFLHHLDDETAVQALWEMGRVSRRGLIAADLLRSRRAYAWITLFTLTANPMVRHDARVSVAQAFTLPEVGSLRDRAGLSFTATHRHFGHRFVLAGEKPAASS